MLAIVPVLLQHGSGPLLRDGVRGQSEIGEELDFDLSRSRRLRFILQESLLSKAVWGSVRPFDFKGGGGVIAGERGSICLLLWRLTVAEIAAFAYSALFAVGGVAV